MKSLTFLPSYKLHLFITTGRVARPWCVAKQLQVMELDLKCSAEK